jgi:hypothetical protein
LYIWYLLLNVCEMFTLLHLKKEQEEWENFNCKQGYVLND